MKNNLLAIGVLLCILILPTVTQANTEHYTYFRDVYVTDVFSGYINKLAAAGIINTENLYFRPTDQITRSETVGMLQKAAGIENNLSCDHRFEDIGESHPFHEAIQTFVCEGIIATNTRFEGDRYTTRGQFSKMAVVALDIPIDTSLGPSFYDVDADNPFYIYIESLKVSSIGSGFPDGTFRPDQTIQRREAAKLSVHYFDDIRKTISLSLSNQ